MSIITFYENSLFFNILSLIEEENQDKKNRILKEIQNYLESTKARALIEKDAIEFALSRQEKSGLNAINPQKNLN